ncbi:MAG: ABC transporter substrate-binding protein [Actinomycetota bacterium]|nr:ABC transporter substrate-binding protein [Actinomycetota bacterium]
MGTWTRLTAPVLALGFALAACGGGDRGAPGTTEEPTEPAPAVKPAADAKLDLGYILPETGPLAFLGPPMIQGVRLAVEDLNRAGGVLGQKVTLATGDEAGDAARVREAAARQLNQGVDAVVGAGASGMSQEIIQTLRDNNIVQCSPSNTSPVFSTQQNADFYFRTVLPDDAVVAPIIANQLVSDGAQKVVLLGRADDYGRALSNLIAEQLRTSGADVPPPIIYDPKATTFTAEVQQATSQRPGAAVLASFDEGVQLIKGLLESGMTPSRLYGGDGLFAPSLPEKVDPSNRNVIDGMTVFAASGGRQFNERLNQVLPPNEQGNFIYGGQSYDCAVLIALAAEAARSADPAVFMPRMMDVSREGRPCSSFQECKTLLGQGADIDYQGVSGPVDFDEVGDPTFGRIAIAKFQNGGQLATIAEREVNLAEIKR